MLTIKKLFPFFLRLDESLHIIERGPSMGKLLDDEGKFEDHFRFIRPNFGIDYTFNSILDFSNQVFIIELKNKSTPIRFKGQFIMHHEFEDELWFCGSPWLIAMENLHENNLFVTDFALHDTAIDTILMMNQNLLSMEDSNKMIEDLRLKNEKLEKINERLDSIIYAITHDFRAPLLASIGLLQLTDELVAEHLPDVLYTLKKLDQTIINLNELAKNDKVDPILSTVNIQELVNEIYKNYQIIFKTEIPLTLIIIEDAPLLSDNFRIRIILSNLISNAIKYSNPEKDAVISITIHVKPEEFTFEISDNGEGIEPKNLKNIFKLFYRGSVKSEGSGIGLYVTKEMVQLLKGTILVESEKNIGTTFTLSLPNYKPV